MKRLLILPALLILWGSTACGQQPAIQAQKFRPQWQTGQQWTVQTQSRQQQVAVGRQRVTRAQWRFQAEAVEPIQGRSCVRISIRPLEGQQVQQEPKTTVWVDQATTSIRQIQTQLPTAGGYKTVTESYKPGQQAAPVIGPLSVLPIALPQFPEKGVKAIGTFSYDTISGPGGIKAIGQVGFTTQIHQAFTQPTAELVKSIYSAEGIKDFANREVIEVKLSTADETVRQVWSANMPWPVFTDNGTTKATLIAVGPRPAVQPQPPQDAAPAGNALPANEGVKALDSAGAVEQAKAAIQPWSGYWWPIREGRLIGPLTKYDSITGHKAAVWEKQHNPADPDVPHWFGYCHAWAAASVLESEPNKDRSFPAGETPVALDVGDQKGLLTTCHTEDLANSWGDRFGDGEGSEDPQDLSPDKLWQLLQMHLGQQKVPLIMDVEAGEEVWNYPVYAYAIRYRPTEGEQFSADLILLMADDAVHPDHQGTKVRKQTHQFTFKMRGGNVVAGSGRWTGASREDHPDFAWYPYKAVATNPEIIRPKVLRLVSSQSTPPADDSPLQPTPPTTPPATPDNPPTTTNPPTTPPADPPTSPPADPPTSPPADPPTSPPADPPTSPPADPPTTPPADPPTTPPADPPTTPPADPPTTPPADPPTTPPADPPTTPPADPPTSPPTDPSASPVPAVSVPAAEEAVEPVSGPIVVSPLELAALIANKTSSFKFDVMLDRFDGGSYKPGETFFVRVKSERPGYLYLLQVDSTGTPALLYPTAGEDNRIAGGKLLDIKPSNAAGGFPVIGPAGIVRVKAVVTTRPLVFSGSLDPLPAQIQQQQKAQDPQSQSSDQQSEQRQKPKETEKQRQEQAPRPVQAQQMQATPVQFRWHPTQQRQIKQLLAGQQQVSAEQIGCRPPQAILGAFAQDMTTFYVDSRPEGGEPKPKVRKKPGKSRLLRD